MKSRIIKLICLIGLALPLLAFGPKQNNKGDNGKVEITERDYNNKEIEMADAWRSNGKIYVVIATISAILAGIIFYLVVLDKKISKLEKETGEG